MPDLTLDLKYLKYALQVAEDGSFRRAADSLSLAQSTVSRRVQILERQLGVLLFERTKTGSGLTPEGQRFLQQAAVGARYLRDAAAEIRAKGRATTGFVRFGMLEAFPICPIIDLLGSFRSQYPSIEVKVEEGTSVGNTSGVRRGLLDAAISLDVNCDGSFQSRRLPNPGLFIALSPNHKLASRPLLSWDDVRDEVFLARSDAAGRELAAQLRLFVGAADGAVQLSIQQVSRETLLTMVERGFGLSVTSAVYRSDIALVPFASARSANVALIWPEESENQALPLLLKWLDKLYTR